MNPWNTALETGFEVFTLNYELLVGLRSGPRARPGLRRVVVARRRTRDGTFTWTFKIPEGKQVVRRPAGDGRGCALDPPVRARRGQRRQAASASATSIRTSSNAGVTKVEAPDATTLVVTNTDPSDRILQMYIPILPKHIWKDQTLESINTFGNDAPVVGSGPYQAVEWQTGQFVRFVRNPNYSGQQGARRRGRDPVLQGDRHDGQALKSGELDYAQGVKADQFEDLKTQPGHRRRSTATTNGWTMLDFNTYGKDIKDGGASTKALRDPAFRDALGYAIDKDRSSSACWAGTGTVGTTQVPPFQARWHVDPGPSADVRHRARQAEADRRRVPARRVRPTPGQGRQADQPAALPADGLTDRTRRPRHSSRTGSVSSGSR